MEKTKWTYNEERSFASNYFTFVQSFVSVLESLIKSWFNVLTTQVSIFILFVSAGVLFQGVFSPEYAQWNNFQLITFKVSRINFVRYLSDIIPSTTRRYYSRNANNIPWVKVNNNYFMKIFSPSTIIERSKLDLSIRNWTSLNIFEGRLLQFERPLENSVFTSHNPIRIKYLTRLRLDFVIANLNWFSRCCWSGL